MSNEEDRTFVEYAVRWPGKGNYHPSTASLKNGVWDDNLRSQDEAQKRLADAKRVYAAMGVPEAAEQLRVVQRTVTITYEEWSDVKSEVSAS